MYVGADNPHASIWHENPRILHHLSVVGNSSLDNNQLFPFDLQISWAFGAVGIDRAYGALWSVGSRHFSA